MGKMDTGTVMYGVFGDPVQHSKSPLMMNRAFQELGINAVYAAFHVRPEELKAAVNGIRALHFRGVNVTIPHKQTVMHELDEIDEGARIIGAVNTIVNDGGRLIGYNTDGIGYVRSLKEETNSKLSGKQILILGAGGAARGVAYALAQENPEGIWIANRTEQRAVELAEALSGCGEGEIQGIAWDQIAPLARQIDVVVNTTMVGMHPHIEEMPVDPAWLHEGMLVSDIIYNPMRTKLLQTAESIGASIHSGLGMFIHQGAYAFEYWTGQQAPTAVMRETVERALTRIN